MSEFRRKTGIRGAIVPIGSFASVGTVGLTILPERACAAELGIVIARSHWGTGLGTAVARLVTRYAFATLGPVEIRAGVLERNPASIRLLEKAGFQRTGVMPSTATEAEALVRYVLARPGPTPA